MVLLFLWKTCLLCLWLFHLTLDNCALMSSIHFTNLLDILWFVRVSLWCFCTGSASNYYYYHISISSCHFLHSLCFYWHCLLGCAAKFSKLHKCATGKKTLRSTVLGNHHSHVSMLRRLFTDCPMLQTTKWDSHVQFKPFSSLERVECRLDNESWPSND